MNYYRSYDSAIGNPGIESNGCFVQPFSKHGTVNVAEEVVLNGMLAFADGI